MLLIYGRISIIILKIKLVIAFKIWIDNSIQSLNFGSLIQSCQIGVLVQSIHSCGTLIILFVFFYFIILWGKVYAKYFIQAIKQKFRNYNVVWKICKTVGDT